MKAESKQLLKQNNKREKEISDENSKIYTDMIVYLRGSQLSMSNQEHIRSDLINMIVDGQNRNENIEQIMGKDYKKICDEIIEALPPKTLSQRIWGAVSTAFMIGSILIFIWTAQDIIFNAIEKNDLTFTLSTGRLAGGVLIVITAILLVEYVCRASLSGRKDTRLSMFLMFLVFFAVFSLIVGVMWLLKAELFTIKFYYSFIIVAVSAIISKVSGNIADY